MKKTIIDISGNVAYSNTTTDENYWGNILKNIREEIVETLIEELPKAIPCTFHSRSQPETASATATVAVNFLMDDGVSFLNYQFKGSASETSISVRFTNTASGTSGTSVSFGGIFNLLGDIASHRLRLDIIYNNIFFSNLYTGLESSVNGFNLVKIDINDTFELPNHWFARNSLGFRLAGGTADFASLAVSTLPHRKHGTLNNPEIIKISKNLVVRDSEVIGELGGDNGEIILTSSISTAIGLPTGSFANREVLINDISYYHLGETTSYSLLAKI